MTGNASGTTTGGPTTSGLTVNTGHSWLVVGDHPSGFRLDLNGPSVNADDLTQDQAKQMAELLATQARLVIAMAKVPDSLTPEVVNQILGAVILAVDKLSLELPVVAKVPEEAVGWQGPAAV